jgi:DNA-binding transcriptional ArsR family regulator
MRIRKEGPFDMLMDEEEVLAAAKISDALAHPVRIRILRYILTENFARRDVTNKDLVQVFDYAQATISQHLSKLVIGGLLDVRKKGTSSCYFARIGRLTVFTDLLKKIDAGEDEGDLPDFLRDEMYKPEDSSSEIVDDLQFNYFSSEGFGGSYDEGPRDL